MHSWLQQARLGDRGVSCVLPAAVLLHVAVPLGRLQRLELPSFVLHAHLLIALSGKDRVLIAFDCAVYACSDAIEQIVILQHGTLDAVTRPPLSLLEVEETAEAQIVAADGYAVAGNVASARFAC